MSSSEPPPTIPTPAAPETAPPTSMPAPATAPAVPRASGLKPPSKIARPSGLPKPSSTAPSNAGAAEATVPPSPRHAGCVPAPPLPVMTPSRPAIGAYDAGATAFRRPSDDISRLMRLADVAEALEDDASLQQKYEEDQGRSDKYFGAEERRYSADLGGYSPSRRRSSNSSLEQWEWLQARRLSEAGVRRTSDTSVVLTEDTDSFIIGDKVWVGGTKPGQIAFIGDTQFAPGEWAGVVLDEPIGKNDGSVAGTRYFQCEAKRGVFSRLTRLTRSPLDGSGAVARLDVTSSNGAMSARKITPSLTTSPTSSIQRSPTPSLDGSMIGVASDFKLGDRVIVKSSQGSKPGNLRYIGTTEFANGEWAGVELDEPMGKNDGSVAGKRYFECRPKFGLFAPLHKISHSPSSRRTSAANCVVHRGSTAGMSSIRRQGSRESLTSVASIASSRASVTPSARVRLGVTSLTKKPITPRPPTAGATQTALQGALRDKDKYIEQLLKERDLERAEVTRAASQADEAEQHLALLRQEYEQFREQSVAQSTDTQQLLERTKVERDELQSQLEEMQFRVEEESIIRADVEKLKLEQEVSEKAQGERVMQLEQQLAQEQARAEKFEKEANRAFEVEEQLSLARDELDTLKSELAKKQTELAQSSEQLSAGEAKLKEELEKLKAELESTREALSKQDASLGSQLGERGAQLVEAQKMLAEREVQITQMKDELTALQTEFKNTQEQLHQASEVLTKEKQAIGDQALVMESKDKNIQELTQKLGIQSEEVLKLANELENARGELTGAKEQAVTQESHAQALDADLKNKVSRLVEVEALLEQKTKEANELQADLTLARSGTEETSTQVTALNLRLTEKDAELKEKSTLLNDLTVKLTDQENESKKLLFSLEQLRAASEETATHLAAVNTQLSDKDKELLNGTAKLNEIENLLGESKKVAQQLEEDLAKARTGSQENSSKVATLSTQLSEKEAELTKATHIIEKQTHDAGQQQNELQGMQGKLQSLEEHLSSQTSEMQQMQLQLGDLQRKNQAAEERGTQLLEQKQKLEADIDQLMNSSSDSSVQLSKLNSDVREREKERDALQAQLTQAGQESASLQQRLQQALAAHEEHSTKLVEDHAASVLKLEQTLTATNQNLEAIITASEDTKNKLQQLLDETTQKLESALSKAEETENSLSTKLSMTEKKLADTEAANLESLKKFENELLLLREQLQTSEMEKAQTQTMWETLQQSSSESQQLLSKELTEAKTSVSELQVFKQQLEEKLNASEGEGEKLKKVVEDMEKGLNSNQQEMGKKLSEVQESLSIEQAAKQKLEDDLGSTRSLLDQTQEAKMQLELQLKAISEKVDQLNTESLQNVEKLTQTNNELSELNAAKVQLEDKLKEASQKLEKSQAEKQQTEERLAQTSCSLQEVTESKQQLEQALAQTASLLTAKETDLKSTLEAQKIGSEQRLLDLAEEKKAAEAKARENELKLQANIDELQGKILEISKATESARLENEQTVSQLKNNVANLESEKAAHVAEKLEKDAELAKVLENLSSTEKLLQTAQAGANDSSAEASKQLLELKTLMLEQQEATKSDLANMQQKYEVEKLSLEQQLKASRTLLEKKDQEGKQTQAEVKKLREEQEASAAVGKKVEALQRDKQQLEGRVTQLTAQVSQLQATQTVANMKVSQQQAAKPQTNNNNQDSSLQMQEEREAAQGQINFLNSVIVDMQRKNEELKARVEILEMGIRPEDADEMQLDNIKPRMVAPRLFCDICDEFDLHDTEDCPKQTEGDSPPPTPKDRKKEKPADRPYCDICEIFGHATEDCNDDETF